MSLDISESYSDIEFMDVDEIEESDHEDNNPSTIADELIPPSDSTNETVKQSGKTPSPKQKDSSEKPNKRSRRSRSKSKYRGSRRSRSKTRRSRSKTRRSKRSRSRSRRHRRSRSKSRRSKRKSRSNSRQRNRSSGLAKTDEKNSNTTQIDVPKEGYNKTEESKDTEAGDENICIDQIVPELSKDNVANSDEKEDSKMTIESSSKDKSTADNSHQISSKEDETCIKDSSKRAKNKLNTRKRRQTRSSSNSSSESDSENKKNRHRKDSSKSNHQNSASKRRKITSPVSSRKRHIGSKDSPAPSPSIIVFGIPLSFKNEDLFNLLPKQDEALSPTSTSIAMDKITGISRGFGFMNFTSVDAATSAMSFVEQNMSFNSAGSYKLSCRYSITHRAHSPTPHYYLGCKKTYRSLSTVVRPHN